MQAERWPHCNKAGDFSAPAEGFDEFIKINVAKTVTVIGEKYLLARNVLAHGSQPFAHIAPRAGIDHGDAPVLLRISDQFNPVAGISDDAVGIGLRLIVQKIFLNDIRFVTKT